MENNSNLKNRNGVPGTLHIPQFSYVPLSALRTFQIVTSGITQPFYVLQMVFPITTSFTFWSTTDRISITFL